jgi:hypothetical protein
VWELFKSLRKTFAVEYPLKNCSVALSCAWILRISAYKEKREIEINIITKVQCLVYWMGNLVINNALYLVQTAVSSAKFSVALRY